MGNQFTEDLADSELSLEAMLAIHLQSNHYPPVPLAMVPVCIKALDSYNEHLHGNELIELPDGTSWRGAPMAPVWAIIESHHLGEWCFDSED